MTALLGTTVITHYNRKTYRIDDIDFSMTPESTFDQHGTIVSFFNFNIEKIFKLVYKYVINVDKNYPLICFILYY